ncbi:TerB family tellurite resistance protein [Ignavibacterium album]|uniref:tellurite resistance TerB family protein n=1 Tax=Ignavibacterium album TaxID=591197 RepID=UPI0035BA724C
MNTVTFDRLLLKTAFCCMASDGDIDIREVDLIKTLCSKSDLFDNINITEELNKLIERINHEGKEFIKYYFNLLDVADLSEEDELTLIDFALETIHADGIDQYSEIKFFKNIRYRLKVSNQRILINHPEIQYWLEDDIMTGSFLEKITGTYLSTANLPLFSQIDIEPNNLQ